MITIATLFEGVKAFLEPIVANTVIQVLAKHFADPAFAPKAQAWSDQFQKAQAGGTKDDLAKASSDLQSLMSG